MPVYLVRHAKAGSRDRWKGADVDRPLSKTGWAQSNRLGRWFAKVPVSSLVSSPYVRCVQTLQPTADQHGLKVESATDLAEGAPVEPVLELLASLDDHGVLCTHGDVLLATLDGLVRRGLHIAGKPDYRKGVVWVIEGSGGDWARARALPPR